MERKIFNKLIKHRTTSWAIWDPDDIHTVEFFEKRLEDLHARTVIVGLNPSEGMPPYRPTHLPNFHTPGNVGDRRLKRHIQDANLANLLGCFMTDVSNQIKSKSESVVADPATATTGLVDKIFHTGSHNSRTIVCLGDKAFDILRNGFGIPRRMVSDDPTQKLRTFETRVEHENWRVYRVWHSANYGRFLNKSENELGAQLSHINGQCAVYM